MDPVSVIQTTLKVNKPVGQFLLAGLAVLAGGALILSWGSDRSDMAVAGIYILAFALASSILVVITRNEKMRLSLCWTLVVAFAAFIGGLVDSAFHISGRLPPLACYLRLPVELPETCIGRLTDSVMVVGEDSARFSPASSQFPERIWLAQATVDNARSTLKTDGPVFVQFGQGVQRRDVIKLTTMLTSSGWTVEGADQGGEQVKATPGQNEVRFFHPEDRDSAVALAELLFQLNPATPVNVRDFSRLGAFTKAGQLEIWLKQVTLAGG